MGCEDQAEEVINAILRRDRFNRYVPRGWAKLVEPLVARADEVGAEIYQVKEKFGTLRFYCNRSIDPTLSEMIDAAEVCSASTCTECGSYLGRLGRYGGYYYAALCAVCHKERIRKIEAKLLAQSSS